MELYNAINYKRVQLCTSDVCYSHLIRSGVLIYSDLRAADQHSNISSWARLICLNRVTQKPSWM